MSDLLARGEAVSIRRIDAEDLERIAPHAYSVSIFEPLDTLADLRAAYARTSLWETDAGAVAIQANDSSRLVGTCQFYRSGPCIHGLEIGYIVHGEADRGRGFASGALALLSAYLFAHRRQHLRHQLTIDVNNEASWRVAERCGFAREGVLRRSGFPPQHGDCFVYAKVREADA